MGTIFDGKKEWIRIRRDLINKIGKIEIEIKGENLYTMRECELYIDNVNWGKAFFENLNKIVIYNRELLKKYNIKRDSFEIKLDCVNKLKAIQKEYKEKLKKEFFDRKIRLIAAKVPVDSKERVLEFKDYSYEVYYNFLNEEVGKWAYVAEYWLPEEIPFKDGLDVTDVFWEEYYRRKERKEKIEKLKKIAKKENKKQILCQYTINSTNKNSDCISDKIVIYVYPNGKIGQERIQTNKN
ncbi:MAG: hypothetical protein NC816_00705 [Candidatus Omnitrophica bacterium]|nr:hypothetical protein [Candidatus Omnitrophota bacterium]